MTTPKLQQRVVRHSRSDGPGHPDVWGIYEPDTGSVQYICADPASRKAALIDVVWNFDPTSYRFSTESMDQVLDLVRENDLEVAWVLDTHPHADHVMAAAHLKDRTGAPNAIGDKVSEIAQIWAEIYNLPDAFDPARDFDRLLADGETFAIGDLEIRVMLSPGHTLGSVTYVCGDAAFTIAELTERERIARFPTYWSMNQRRMISWHVLKSLKGSGFSMRSPSAHWHVDRRWSIHHP